MIQSTCPIVAAVATSAGVPVLAPTLGVVDAAMITAIAQAIVLILSFFAGKQHEKRRLKNTGGRDDSGPQDPGSAGEP